MKKMEVIKLTQADAARCALVDLTQVPREVTEEDAAVYRRVISTEITEEQAERIAVPRRAHPTQEDVLAVHWHPEYVPMELIRRRVETLYPQHEAELIIPTQHNEILEWGDYAGVEVDCYSSGFNRKVQLLLHFRKENVAGERAHTLRSMLSHTFEYRSSQLFEFLDSASLPAMEERRLQAAEACNADADIVEFAAIFSAKLRSLIEDNWSATPRDAIKNKLLRNFLDEFRPTYGDLLLNKTQVYLKALKELVKQRFSLTYFYRASEIIEEARSLGAGVVIPHPEQFWPILLADYDVDGIEVWNPQSREYTEFLIRAVNRQNDYRCREQRQLLIFMGDDCHMSEKLKDPALQDPEKAAREIGLQPAWDDLAVRKSLILCGVSRAGVIDEYRARLNG
ncbi:hypothetical protein dsx2_2942 [Desulfovibrio sp. X2]|uniref:hypothetical protein n=1 Tax=Desulfovibrio sp. X2 TaxID=941449 RepID=UPI000358C1FC|nr:hypothetical protein [Desulfovibrio sp. X2]EPR41938.1 hypothetical protein dsx2_2942 [Desulfovibrio sp. X2]